MQVHWLPYTGIALARYAGFRTVKSQVEQAMWDTFDDWIRPRMMGMPER